jgi:NAD(P)-dependent dehydrogenase (short-subunit alcohol dehydrogenase family)
MKSKAKWTHNDIANQSGKIVLVTGANSGTGFEAAKELAGKNATVIMAVRSLEKGNEAAAKIKKDFPKADVTVMKLDLSSLASVRKFSADFIAKHDRLDILINNAGVMVPPYSKTEDGFELQFGTNHLGHFALTGLLIDLLLKTPNSRIVTMSSMAHKSGKVDFNDLHREKKYKKMETYGQSKVANLFFTYELQRKLEAIGSKTIAVAAHPGWAVTNLSQHHKLFEIIAPVFGQTALEGAWPLLYAATDSDVKGGDYYGPEGFMEIKGHPKKVLSNTYSQNLQVADQLWEKSVELTGVKFEALEKKKSKA